VICAALALVGAACTTSPVEPSQVEPAVCAAGQIDGNLRIHLAGDVLPPGAVTDFSSRFGVEVEVTSYEATDELIAQIEARVSDYDLIIPSDATIRVMREADLLVPLSPDAIPGVANLMERFNDPPYDPGSAHSVPFTWGTIGLGVNLNVAGGVVPETWGMVFDPEIADRFAGRISLVDDARLAIGAALKYLGYSLNSQNQDEIDEAAALLETSRVRLAGFTGIDDAVALVNGETDVAQGSSRAMFDAYEAADAWDDYTYIVPAEGTAITVDAMAVPVTAAHPCTAHTFIDFMLEPGRGVAVARWNRAASPNMAANEVLPGDVRDDRGLYPPGETIANLEFIGDIESTVSYVDAFERARR